jgi:hypothetical protein
MKGMKIISLFLIIIIIEAVNLNAHSHWPVLKGPYLGQKPPGVIPEIFAPGIISGPFDERISFFSPDGREFYYGLRGVPHTLVVYLSEKDGRWRQQETAFFSGKYFCEFSLSPDGNTIIYCSNQPENGDGPPEKTWRTWIVEKTGSKWGEPQVIDLDTGYPVLSSSKNLYFFNYRKNGDHDGQIYMVPYRDGYHSEPINIGNARNKINTPFHEVDPYIAPDESYLIFCSNRKGGYGDADLYICYKKRDGSWAEAKNMGATINTKATEFCPSVTTDRKYLFFSSNRVIHQNYSPTPLPYEDKINALNSCGNGSNDIYWVDAGIIDVLRPKNLQQSEKQ